MLKSNWALKTALVGSLVAGLHFAHPAPALAGARRTVCLPTPPRHLLLQHTLYLLFM